MKTISLFFLAFMSVSRLFGQGIVLWDKNVNGPISENYSLPTPFGILSLGSNSITATTSTEPVEGNWTGHGNYFAFAIASGQRVDSLFLTIDNVGVNAWIGNPGFGLPTFASTGGAQTGNLLIQMGVGSIPFGTYGMYMENTDFQPFPSYANYRLDFVVTAVPEPSTWALLGLGGALLWPALRRRGK